MNKTPEQKGEIVSLLVSALNRGGSALSTVPSMLKSVIELDAWKDFTTKLGEEIHHDSLIDFIEAEPLAGLGCSCQRMKDIIRSDMEARDMLDKATQRTRADNKALSSNRTKLKDPNKRGTTGDGALRKLRKDAPELHAEVLAGKLSPHAAMVKAGFRKKTFTIQDDIPSAAKTLRRRFGDKVPELIEALREEGNR